MSVCTAEEDQRHSQYRSIHYATISWILIIGRTTPIKRGRPNHILSLLLPVLLVIIWNILHTLLYTHASTRTRATQEVVAPALLLLLPFRTSRGVYFGRHSLAVVVAAEILWALLRRPVYRIIIWCWGMILNNLEQAADSRNSLFLSVLPTPKNNILTLLHSHTFTTVRICIAAWEQGREWTRTGRSTWTRIHRKHSTLHFALNIRIPIQIAMIWCESTMWIAL